MSVRRSLAARLVLGASVVLAALLAVLLAPSPAWAHARLVASQPEDGQSLDVLPDVVSLAFSEDMMTLADVVVTGPDGASVAVGSPQVSGGTVTQRVQPGGRGQYVLAYRTTSVDGHPLTGQIRFAVGEAAVAPDEVARETPAESDAGGSSPEAASLWHRDVVVPSLLFAGALVLLALSRRVPGAGSEESGDCGPGERALRPYRGS